MIDQTKLDELKSQFGSVYVVPAERFGGLEVVFRKPSKIEFKDYAGVMRESASVGELAPEACALALKVIVHPSRDVVAAHLDEYDLLANRLAADCARLRLNEETIVAKKQ